MTGLAFGDLNGAGACGAWRLQQMRGSCSPESQSTMRSHPLGRDAARIGSVVDDPNRFVQMTTKLGGQRMVDWLSGEQLPRIC